MKYGAKVKIAYRGGDKYRNLEESIKSLGNASVKRIRSTYKGRGRPRKEDYWHGTVKELDNFYATEILQNAFKTTYT